MHYSAVPSPDQLVSGRKRVTWLIVCREICIALDARDAKVAVGWELTIGNLFTNLRSGREQNKP